MKGIKVGKTYVISFFLKEYLPAQLAPVNPVLQVHVPVEASQVPCPEQSSGQVRSYEQNTKLKKESKQESPTYSWKQKKGFEKLHILTFGKLHPYLFAMQGLSTGKYNTD